MTTGSTTKGFDLTPAGNFQIKNNSYYAEFSDISDINVVNLPNAPRIMSL